MLSNLPKYLSQQFIAWIWCIVSVAVLSGTTYGQEEDLPDKPAKESGSLFGRLFPVNKPHAQTAPRNENSSNGGFFVPLKSLTRGMRGKSDVVDSDDLDPRPPTAATPRTPREPFQNIKNRRNDRKDRDSDDVKVEKYVNTPNGTLPSIAPVVTGKDASKSTVESSLKNNPSGSSELVESPTTSSRSNKELNVPDSRPNTLDNASTSRRTNGSNQNSQDEAAGNIRIANSPKTMAEPAAQGKNLLDIAGPSAQVKQQEKAPPKTKAIPTVNTTSAGPDGNAGFQHPREQTRLVKNTREIESPRANPQASSDASMVLSTPQIQLQVRGPNAVLVGQNTPYEVLATNEGNDPIHGLMVRLIVPREVAVGDVAVTEGQFQSDNDENGNAIVWELEHVPPKSTKIARLMLKTSSPEHFAMGVEWTVVPQAGQLPIKVQQPQLQLALEGPSEVDYGRPQVYRLRVRNPGNADVKSVNVELTADTYGSNQSEIGDVPAGSERVVEVELTFQHSGLLPIRARAFSKTGNLESVSNIDVQVRQSSLVAEWFGPSEFYQGSTAEYELTLQNQGTIPALNNVCRIKLPVGVDIVSLPPGLSRSGDQLRWDIKRLDPQEKISYPIRLLMNKLGANSLEFVSESTTGENTKTSISTQVDAVADLHLTVTDPVAPAPVGKPVTYEITITNRGKKSAEDVYVIAQFSDGIEPLRLEGQPGKIIPGQALFDVIPSIGPNEHVTIKVLAEASKPGVHRFRAAVKCQGSDDDLLEEESTRYTASNSRGSDRK